MDIERNCEKCGSLRKKENPNGRHYYLFCRACNQRQRITCEQFKQLESKPPGKKARPSEEITVTNRNCPNCNAPRKFDGVKGKRGLYCSPCKSWQNITEAEFSILPRLTFKPSGFFCYHCGGQLTTFSKSKGFCYTCRKNVSYSLCTGKTISDILHKGMAKVGLTARNTSGFKGVSFWKGRGKFAAEIKNYGKRYFLGFYNNAIDAAIAYNIKALEFFGPDAFQNDISQYRNPKDYEYGTKGFNPYA